MCVAAWILHFNFTYGSGEIDSYMCFIFYLLVLLFCFLFVAVFLHFPIVLVVLMEWTIKAKPLFLHKRQHWCLSFSTCLDSSAKQQYFAVQLLLQLEIWLGSWTNPVLFLLLMQLSLSNITGLILWGKKLNLGGDSLICCVFDEIHWKS